MIFEVGPFQSARTSVLALLVALPLAVGCQSSPDSKPDDSAEMAKQTSNASAEKGPLPYPETRRQDLVETIHGQKVRDPYRWLEDSDAEAVETWQSRQDDIARQYIDALPEHDALEERLRELYYVESVSAPTRRGDRVFYKRRPADAEKGIYYWRPADAPRSEAEVLLNPNEMGGDKNISIGGISPSWDGQKVAYMVSVNNADQATIKVESVESGEVSDVDVIEGGRWASPVWTPDNEGFYYTHFPTDESIPKAKRPGKADIRYHELGTDPANDEIVRAPTNNPRTFVGVDLSHDGRWLIAYVWHGWNRSDVYYRDLASDDPEWQTLVEGKQYAYQVEAWKDHFYIKTDEKAPKSRILRAPATNPARENWTEIVSEREDAVLEGIGIVGGHIAAKYLVDAHGQLELFEPDGTSIRTVDVPGVGYVSGLSGTPDRETGYFAYESFKQPRQIYEVSVETEGTTTWSELDVPVDTSNIEVEQVWYDSKDGTEVSMYVVHRADIPMDGSTPLLMTGYGGFNVSLQPYFNEQLFPWLEAGGAFAMPNLRGGGEYGEEWHEAGMLENKQNTFDDFIAAAEYLIDEGYTSADRLAIRGASNGGLLVSAVTTQRPELFGAVLCGVPLTDMVRYHEFGPAKIWMPEYGNPDKKEHFEFLYDYSPYHHVEKGSDYPSFMMLSSASDDRVHPMHARKFTAALQWATDSPNPVLFRLERQAGHGGADMVKKRVAKDADTLAFLMNELGVTSETPAWPVE